MISSFGGLIQRKISATYEDCLEITIQVCKYSCVTDIQEISSVEVGEISRWLNRKGFYKLKFLDEDNVNFYHMASVRSINRIEIDGRLMGLELNFITDSPFPRKEPKTVIVNNTTQNGKYSFNICKTVY